MLGRLLGNRLISKQTFTPCRDTGAAQWRRGHQHKKKIKKNPGRRQAEESKTGGYETAGTEHERERTGGE